MTGPVASEQLVTGPAWVSSTTETDSLSQDALMLVGLVQTEAARARLRRAPEKIYVVSLYSSATARGPESDGQTATNNGAPEGRTDAAAHPPGRTRARHAFRMALETLSLRTSAKVGREVVFTPRMTRATDPAQRFAATVELVDWDAVHEVGRTGCIEAFVDDLAIRPGSLAIVVREMSSERPSRAGPAQRILVVDDEPHLRRLAARILTADGHTVSEAASIAEASDILARKVVDTVVSDLMMPGEDGFALANTVARQFPSARFVIASGIGPDINPIDALARRVSVVLSKPYSVAELREAVQRETVELDTA